MVKMHDTMVNSLYCGHCRDLESVSSLTSVRNSGSFFQSNLCNLFLPGISVLSGCPLTVTGSACSSLFHKTLKSAVFKGFLGEGNLMCDRSVRISTFLK